MKISEDGIFIDLDIFASSFLMLTRWEEILDEKRDLHGRCKAANSIAEQWGFLHRPVVDEYADLLLKCLIHLGYNGPRKKNEFTFLHTHDVDEIEKWKGTGTLAKTIGADVLKRKSLQLAKKNLKQQKAVKKGTQKDPYDTFDELMDISESKGVTSHFFFLHQGSSQYDNGYSWDDPVVRKTIQHIKNRGHQIGLHPSYNTLEKKSLFQKEKNKLEQLTAQPVTTGRQHYLRFNTPETWQLWEDHGMDWDSSLYYSEKAGFRCGTCRAYPVFNVSTGKALQLKELPLTIMDSTFFNQIEEGHSEIVLKEIIELLNRVKQHQGQFVLLWHTNYLNLNIFARHKQVYLELLRNL